MTQTSGRVLGASTDDTAAKLTDLQNQINALASLPRSVFVPSFSGPAATTPVSTATFAQSQRIDNLSGTSLSNITVNGVSGLTAADIPALSYLPLSGGTVTGDLTVNGSFSGGGFSLSIASTTNLVATNATTTNATSTNFFATTASSTNLFSTNANIGVLSLGSLNLTSPLSVSSGGTGWASLAAGYVPFGNGSSALATSSSFFWDNSSARLGIGTTSPQFTFDVNGVMRGNVYDKGGASFNVKAYGAKGDGVTGDSNAVLTAIQAAANAGGGTVTFPVGTYLIASQLLIPNNGASPRPFQRNIRLTGVGGGKNWFSPYGTLNGLNNNAAALDLRYSGSGGKIQTLGAGALQVDNLTLEDNSSPSDTTPFLYTTNTVLTVRDNNFIGSATTTQDAIVLGGTSTSLSATISSPFQGYGTVIDSNHFSKLNRGVYIRTYGNNITITNNTWEGNTGTRAIESDGSAAPANGNFGLVVTGNLIEMDANYIYGIVLNATANSEFSDNSFWDPGSQVLKNYFLTNLSTNNTFISGQQSTSTNMLGGDAISLGLSNIIGNQQNARDTTGYGFAGSELANGLVIKGIYDSTQKYPGPLTVTDWSNTADHITVGFDKAHGTGILDSATVGIGGLPLTLNSSGGKVGIGTTSPASLLALYGAAPVLTFGDTQASSREFQLRNGSIAAGIFDIYDLGNAASRFTIGGSGNIGIGTTTPGSPFAINGIANFTTATSSFYSTGGINLTSGGCFAVNGVCVSGGGGAGLVL
jgi:Pectate lyase superfamily protein